MFCVYWVDTRGICNLEALARARDGCIFSNSFSDGHFSDEKINWIFRACFNIGRSFWSVGPIPPWSIMETKEVKLVTFLCLLSSFRLLTLLVQTQIPYYGKGGCPADPIQCITPRKTRGITPILFKSRFTVCDAGPALKQHVNDACWFHCLETGCSKSSIVVERSIQWMI